MSLIIHLLGRPSIEGGSTYRFRSRKSWALLAYLLRTERPPTRSRLASLLFPSAEDPLRALRWNLSELRRALGEAASVDGNPVELRLPEDAVVDTSVVVSGSWTDAVTLPGLGAELLEGISIRDAAAYESWLLAERRHIAAASEATLHEAALASMSRGEIDGAIDYALRVVALNPYEESHQALLIRAYRMAGDADAARRQYEACTQLFTNELGIPPGPAVKAAANWTDYAAIAVDETASIDAIVEAGAAAVAAGAVETGVHSLRSGVVLADRTAVPEVRVTSRLALAEALIHTLRGEDEEGTAILHEAAEIATTDGEAELGAAARVELGYVDFLAARYDRSEQWLNEALRIGRGDDAIKAKALTYLGSVESDRANYPRAAELLGAAIELADVLGDVRREAYARSMVGRFHLLRGDLDDAAETLDHAIELTQRDQWLAFLPWPQAFRGEVAVARGELDEAEEILQQAFARACQLGDPCWEGASARALAQAASARGDTEAAFQVLADARSRCNRLSDTYVWLDAYILDAMCSLGLRTGHSQTAEWVGVMHDLASRTGMRELVVRSLLHRAALGSDGDAAMASLLAAEIDNPVLARLAD